MDKSSRDEIAASAATHAELGPGYDQVVAEGLVERIGTEIDKRVAAGLARQGAGAANSRAGPAWPMLAMGLGSAALGTAATAIVLHAWAAQETMQTLATGGSGVVVFPVAAGSPITPRQFVGLPSSFRLITGSSVSVGQVVLVAVIWVIIGVINVAYAVRIARSPAARPDLTDLPNS
jgi:hypothetical protein